MVAILLKKAVAIPKLKKQDEVLRREAEESLESALSVSQNDPKTQEWLKSHKDLWYR